MQKEIFETVIIGGGQAGLSAGYHLARQGRTFVILDAGTRVGDAWRNRWDSLRLFTPARFSGLDGWRFPAPKNSFPTKDEMGDYLEAYATKFGLPVRNGVRVDGLAKRNGHFEVTAGDSQYEADNVIVATGAHHVPKVPAFARQLDKRIRQIHSVDYKSPPQLREGAVLIVGLGNSGAEIAYEVVKSHQVHLSGKPSAELPFRHGKNMARFVFPVIRFLGHNVLKTSTPIGRKVGPKFVHLAAPLIRVKTKHLTKAGVERVARVAGVKDGRPALEDGRVLDVANVIWCTGFREEYSWIDLDILGDDDRPKQVRGVSTVQPGLYFVGLKFQYAATSDVLPGVGRDAAYVARQIATHATNGDRSRTPTTAGR